MLRNIKEVEKNSTQTKIQQLGDDVYEHFLREAGDCTNPEEWYQIALAVADLFREQILISASRNMVSVATAPWDDVKMRPC